MASVIQSKRSGWVLSGHANAITLNYDSTPTNGNTLVAFLFCGANGTGVIDSSGWTHRDTELTTDNYRLRIYTKVAGAAETTTVHVPVTGNSDIAARDLAIFEVDGDLDVYDIAVDTSMAQLNGPSLTPSAGGIALVGVVGHNQTYVGTAALSAVSPLSTVFASLKESPGRAHSYAAQAVTDGTTYAPAINNGSPALQSPALIGIVFLTARTATPPVAEFSADLHVIDVGGTVQFTDLSTNSPTSWAWDFGDGGTSTSQNPSHVFAAAGTYSVTLTATNADGSDSETKSGFITVRVITSYEEPPPALALIEIYASEPGSAKWDEANWDEAVWSTAGWQDVTPESVHAVVQWGSSEPELGILSRPSAGSWSIDTYDPERILDPANEDSPYFGDLEPGLPIRVSHRGVVIRQGVVESMSHGFADDRGFIRVQDAIAALANAKVPSDVDLGDTLFARARAAIAAAGLSVQVLADPPGGDPALVPWVTGTDRTAWQWITDAAESVLYIPYITNVGRLGFRAWASPLARARDLTATELVDLVSLIQYDGQYSVVNALDTDGVTVVERASSPPPRYGARTYSRNSATPNVDDWLEAVLADRVRAGLRWIPGEVYPLTANSVEKYATIEAVEVISLSHLYTSPVVAEDIIIVGGRIELTAKKDDEALWAFQFQAAETAQTPLITEDGAGFVLSEGGDQFLYPE